MNDQDVCCSGERLHKLLHSEQDDDDACDAAAHLEHCSRCQRRLEALAAQPRDWRFAQESLALNDAAEADDRDDHRRSFWATMRWQRTSSGWSESMARQMLAPPSHPEMLGRIGRYEVERAIGSGGMGVVFKAYDTELNRPVAVKVLAPYLAGSGAARKRFAREARAAAAIVHEHVVAIHNVETEGDWPFLVMHYVAGESLQQRLNREGPLELCEILRIGLQTAAALAAAHAQGLVHRDVKPSNILLEQGIERTLLTDFGLARASDDASVTFTGCHPGTPQYMSPEQARGEAVDARSDLFSLGSVLYAMCTGRPPFRAETTYGVLRRITDSEPRSIREINPMIPDWLERCVTKLLRKSALERFQSAAQVADLLRDCLAHVQQPTAVDLPRECQSPCRSRPGNRLSRALLAAISLATVFVAGLILLAITKLPSFRGDEGGSVKIPAAGANAHRTAALKGELTSERLSNGEPNETDQPAGPKVATVPPQPEPAELLRPFELRLAYFEPGADRTEHTLPGIEQKVYVAGQPFAIITDVAARAIDDASGQSAIEITVPPDSARRIEEVNQRHLNKPVAILADGKLLCAGTIQVRFGGASIIIGQFGRVEAEQIAQKIEAAQVVFRQSVSDIEAGPVWGETVDGLQLAVSGIHQDRHFKSGDTIRFRLALRNVGTEAARFKYNQPEMCYWVAPLVERASGERVQLREMRFRGGHKIFTETLEPGAEVSIRVSGILVLGAADKADKRWPRIETPEPGEYQLRAMHSHQRLDGDGMPIGKYSTLTSGSITFHIDPVFAAAEAEPKQGMDALEGKWSAVSIESVSGESPETLKTVKVDTKGSWIVFDGEEMVRPGTAADGQPELRRFKLSFEADKDPPRFALQTTHPDQARIRYIYEVKGDTLRLCCFSLIEKDGIEVVAWPTKFSTDVDRELFPRLEVWKRAVD